MFLGANEGAWGLKIPPNQNSLRCLPAVALAIPEQKLRDGSQPLAPLHTPAHKRFRTYNSSRPLSHGADNYHVRETLTGWIKHRTNSGVWQSWGCRLPPQLTCLISVLRSALLPAPGPLLSVERPSPLQQLRGCWWWAVIHSPSGQLKLFGHLPESRNRWLWLLL